MGVHCAERGALLERLRAYYVEKAHGFNALCSRRQLEIPEMDAALKAAGFQPRPYSCT